MHAKKKRTIDSYFMNSAKKICSNHSSVEKPEYESQKSIVPDSSTTENINLVEKNDQNNPVDPVKNSFSPQNKDPVSSKSKNHVALEMNEPAVPEPRRADLIENNDQHEQINNKSLFL